MIQLTCDLDDEVRWSPIREFMQFLLTLNLNVKKRKIKNAPETKIETFLCTQMKTFKSRQLSRMFIETHCIFPYCISRYQMTILPM